MPHFEDAIEGDILYLLDRPWHFLCDSRSIYAVPSVEDKIYSCRFNQGISSRFNRGIINHIDSTWPIGVAFRLVVRLGIKLVAISDTLRDVYHFFEGIWMHHETFGPPGLDTEVSLSGYVVLSPTPPPLWFLMPRQTAAFCMTYFLTVGALSCHLLSQNFYQVIGLEWLF